MFSSDYISRATALASPSIVVVVRKIRFLGDRQANQCQIWGIDSCPAYIQTILFSNSFVVVVVVSVTILKSYVFNLATFATRYFCYYFLQPCSILLF